MNPDKADRHEIIEQALREAVGGGAAWQCSLSCHIFSKDVCYVDLCGTPDQNQ